MIERCVFVSLVTITWGSPSPYAVTCSGRSYGSKTVPRSPKADDPSEAMT